MIDEIKAHKDAIMTKTTWDHQVDVLVVGSGNGAMTGAICVHDMGAGEVLLIEKGERFGGSSALSGGGVWVPGNRYAQEAGAQDSFQEALTYLKNTSPQGLVPKSMITTYLKNAPKMIDFLHERTRVRYISLAKYPDYFTDQPGAKTGHRSLEPVPLKLSDLGDEENKLLDGGALYLFYKFAFTQTEVQVLIPRLKGWISILARLALGYYLDIKWLLKGYGISRRATAGPAGIISLRLSMRDRDIPMWLNTEMEDLISEEGRVVGAVVNKQGKTLRIKARKAVLLAAGGFEKNQAMREKYLPKPTNTLWSAGCGTNTGDAIRAGQSLGAKTALMNNAWWCTTKMIPDNEPFLSIVIKSLPGTIVVNKAGKRFSNESQNYMSFLKETYKQHTDKTPCLPCYMVFDETFRKRRSPWPQLIPDFFSFKKKCYDTGLIAKGNSIRELAKNMGIDPDGLQATIERFNQFVDSGKDEDFQRGDAAYDRYYGDPEVKPNPCLGKISKPPFHATMLQAGDIGTQGGLVINENAQVMIENDEVIDGLYACGNCAAAVLPTYPGPGSTLGPAMTFAYQAAKHITRWGDQEGP